MYVCGEGMIGVDEDRLKRKNIGYFSRSFCLSWSTSKIGIFGSIPYHSKCEEFGIKSPPFPSQPPVIHTKYVYTSTDVRRLLIKSIMHT